MSEKASISLEFSESGAVTSLCCDGVEFCAAEPEKSPGLFIIQLRDLIGNPLRLDCSDFSEVVRRAGSDGFELLYSKCRRLRGTAVRVTAKFSDGGISWRIAVNPGAGGGCRCEWVDFPRLRLRRAVDEAFLLPFAEGTLIDHLEEREAAADFKCAYSEYPLSGISGFYPGPAAMQFAACFNGETGLYIGCADASHSPKTLDFRTEGKEARRLMVQSFTGGASGAEFEVVTAAFRGDWRDAAGIYRDWMEEFDPFLPPKLTRENGAWLMDSPVVVAFPVRGRGLDSSEMTPNEYYPYVNALPVLEKFRRKWHTPLLALLMHWEGTAPWAPPYVWPPFGGEAELDKFTCALHDWSPISSLETRS